MERGISQKKVKLKQTPMKQAGRIDAVPRYMGLDKAERWWQKTQYKGLVDSEEE